MIIIKVDIDNDHGKDYVLILREINREKKNQIY